MLPTFVGLTLTDVVSAAVETATFSPLLLFAPPFAPHAAAANESVQKSNADIGDPLPRARVDDDWRGAIRQLPFVITPRGRRILDLLSTDGRALATVSSSKVDPDASVQARICISRDLMNAGFSTLHLL
jgi:hypothetical protein